MTGWGVFLAILGIGSIVLPHFGMQFVLLSMLDSAQPFAGIVIAAIGGVLVFLGMKSGKSGDAEG